MLLALLAYFRVFMVSSYMLESWLMQAIMIVFVDPPRESFSKRVSFESRYGMKVWGAPPFSEVWAIRCWAFLDIGELIPPVPGRLRFLERERDFA